MMTISTPPEFSFAECLRFLNRSPRECLHYAADGELFKPLKVGNAAVLLRVRQNGAGGLAIDFPQGAAGETFRAAAANYICEWLDLERDLKPFYAIANNDSLLEKLARQYYGLRLIGIPDLFEALGWAVIGQQINLQFAYTLKKRLVEAFGEKVVHREREYWLFPAPAVVARLKPEDLLGMQFSRRKAEYLIGIARLLAGGEISREKILGQSGGIENMRRRLQQIRGVGEWTADYVLMKCFRVPSAFPIGDAGLHNALKIQLGLSRKPSLAEIKALARGWKGWEAYATFYLWRSLL
ncbi:MAG: DNA-3-methyladenine glycosylase 2 family protein [Calditrichaceae bacterium]|nr:DNA-3-methyladenine glycosylase [Calditrichia bacterium]NUQ42331.1 DNA-3-methyladenine glycosylase 2 family protein [Calditrichaceae bacterium]